MGEPVCECCARTVNERLAYRVSEGLRCHFCYWKCPNGTVRYCNKQPDGFAEALRVELLRAIEAQRADGWPDMHPEDFCQRCGGPNISWTVDSDRFNTAVNRSEIVCPVCFVKAHEQATGMHAAWEIRPASPFRWITDEGRPTPFLTTTKETAMPATHVHNSGPRNGNRWTKLPCGHRVHHHKDEPPVCKHCPADVGRPGR